MKRLAQITQGIDKGIFPDQPDENAPLWVSGQNAAFRPGYAQPAFGSTIVGQLLTAGAVTGVGNVIRSGAPKYFAGSKYTVYYFSDPTSVWAPTASNATLYTGTDLDPWVFAAWDDWMIFTNGVDHVQIDKAGVAASLDTDSQFSTAKTVCADPGRGFAFAFNTDQGNGLDAWWCDRDDPETWATAASNLAGDITVKDTESEFKCSLMFGTTPVVFTRGAMYAMEFVGAPDVWRITKAQDEVGAVGPHAACTVGGKLYGLGPKGFWESDGVNQQYIDYGVIRDYMFDMIDLDRLDAVVVAHCKSENAIIVSATSDGGTSNDWGVAFNLADRNWTILGFGITALLSTDAADQDLAGLGTGVLIEFGLQATPWYGPAFGYGGDAVDPAHADYGYGEGGYGGYDTGSAGTVTLYSKPINLGFMFDPENYDEDKITHIDHVRVKVENPSDTLVLYVGYRDELEDTTTWNGPHDLSGGSAKVYPTLPFADHKYTLFRLEDSQADERWKLSAIEPYGEILG